MSVDVWTITLVCNGSMCKTGNNERFTWSFDGDTPDPVADARMVAASHGWVLGDDDCDFCPACVRSEQ